MRNNSIMDGWLTELGIFFNTLIPPERRSSARPIPGKDLPDPFFHKTEKEHIAGLVRVNHAGEVCAKALYQGQALTADLPTIREKMHQASLEETDHLAWCEQRLRELDANISIFNPLWYLGSFCIGALAGLAGDAISLGFVAETEKQVSEHLQKHLDLLPQKDIKTQQLLEQMQEDELHHAHEAIQAGGIAFPPFVQYCMYLMSKCMTKTSYYL